jgi:hypothetical protein
LKVFASAVAVGGSARTSALTVATDLPATAYISAASAVVGVVLAVDAGVCTDREARLNTITNTHLAGGACGTNFPAVSAVCRVGLKVFASAVAVGGSARTSALTVATDLAAAAYISAASAVVGVGLAVDALGSTKRKARVAAA